MSSHKPVQMSFTIAIDQREKAPYSFEGIKGDHNQNYWPLIIPTETAFLLTGDYSIIGMEELVCVERKTKEDLYSTLGQNRERFKAEHERMAEMASAVVIVESTLADALRFPPDRSRLLPKIVFRTALSWWHRYGVPWYFVGGRRLAEVQTFWTLEKFWHFEMERRKLQLVDEI